MESKGVPEAHAKVIVEMIRETYREIIAENFSKSEMKQFATKEDIYKAKEDVQKEIAALRTQNAVVIWTQGLIVLTVVVPSLKSMLGL